MRGNGARLMHSREVEAGSREYGVPRRWPHKNIWILLEAQEKTSQMAKKKTTARYDFSARETKVGKPAGGTTPAKKRRIGLTSVQPSKAASSNLNATSIADGLRVILNAYDGKNKSMGGSDMFGADSNDRDKAKKAAWENYESKWFNMGDQQGNKEWKRLKLEEWKLMRQQKKAV